MCGIDPDLSKAMLSKEEYALTMMRQSRFLTTNQKSPCLELGIKAIYSRRDKPYVLISGFDRLHIEEGLSWAVCTEAVPAFPCLHKRYILNNF